MICEFSFSNFRSFKNEAVLDFSARPIKEIEDSLINADKMLFLPVCVIYGPNGGGKSSVLMALKTLQEIIIEPLLQMGFMKNKNEKLASYPVEKLCKEISREGCSEMYYKWDRRSRNDAVVFRILFVAKDKKYSLPGSKNSISKSLFLCKPSIICSKLSNKQGKSNLQSMPKSLSFSS